MIENKFTKNELSRLLRPFLEIKLPSEVIAELDDLLATNLNSLKDVERYTRQHQMTYSGMSFFVYGVGILPNNRVYIALSFRLKKKWWHLFNNPANRVLEDLKQICKEKINRLTFSKYSSPGHDPITRKNLSLIFYYQTDAFNKEWKESMELSSLLISPSENDHFHFIEFYFNPNCYSNSKNGSCLSVDWYKYTSDVVNYIEGEADKLLGIR